MMNNTDRGAHLVRHVCAAIALIATLSRAARAAEEGPDAPKPVSHSLREMEGWSVHVDDRLLDGPDKALGDRALKLLANRLYEITLVVPADKVDRLRHVPIWVDCSHGKLHALQYHPSAGWLVANGYDPAMAKCVHLPDAAAFTQPALVQQQPWVVLHELSHAYHDQVLGFDDADIKAAWQRFVDGGRYRSVPRTNGKMRPHYGLKNQMEFFAEMTEAYFGMNDFFPFNRAELKREEPEIFALLEKVWGPLP